MRFLIALISFIVSLNADFTLKYQLTDNISQEVDYKNSDHVLIKIAQNGVEIEKLIIYNGKKYLTYKENGIEQIFEISDELSEPVDETVKIQKPEYEIIKKETNLKIADFNAEKWHIKYKDKNKTEILTVSNDPKIVNAIKLTAAALKKILPNDRQQDAEILEMGNGYVILETGDLKFLTYKEENLPEKLFAIDEGLSPKKEKELNQNIEKCFTEVCCGNKYSESEELKSFLNSDIENWKLKEVVKCNTPNNENLESAVYSDVNRSIIIEITNSSEHYGKIGAFEKQGIEMDNVKSQNINGFKISTAYLPGIGASIADINLPAGTISIYCKGKQDLSAFAKKAIKVKLKSSYSSRI